MNRLGFWLEKSENKPIELAAHIGKSEQTVKNYRDGVSQPPLDVAMKISEFTGIPVTELLDEVDSEGNLIRVSA
jgi:predicted transcriptional regulator